MRTIILLSLLIFNFENLFAQKKYNVIAIDSFPNVKYYLITLNKVGAKNNTIKLISPYDSVGVLSNKFIPIVAGMTLKINLKKTSINPFKVLNDIDRRGNEPIYIDSQIVYDPKNPLVISTCVKGLYLIKDCH